MEGTTIGSLKLHIEAIDQLLPSLHSAICSRLQRALCKKDKANYEEKLRKAEHARLLSEVFATLEQLSSSVCELDDLIEEQNNHSDSLLKEIGLQATKIYQALRSCTNSSLYVGV